MTHRYSSYRPWPDFWLPEVPTHWKTGSFKHFADFTTGWTPPTGEDAAYVGDHPWANIGDLRGKWISDTVKHLNGEAVEGRTASQVGDLLFAFKLSVGAVARVGCPMFTNEAIATIRSSDELDLGYGYYSLPVFLPMNGNTNIYGAPLLNTSLIRSAAVAVPPLDEQRAIAEYLDRETARIDTLIDEQQRLIGLLRERRAAVLESSVAQLDWSVPLASVASLIQTGPFGSQLKSEEYEIGGTPVVNPSHLIDGTIVPDPRIAVGGSKAYELSRHYLRNGDVVVARRGELGRCSVVDSGSEGYICGTGSAVVRPDSAKLNARFLALVFRSRRNRDALALVSVGSTMENLNASILSSLRIPLPFLVEQERVVNDAAEQTAKIDTLIAETERFIELARERRAALITAAVTGQIDVREVA